MRELWIGGSLRQRLSPRVRTLCLKLGVSARRRHEGFKVPSGRSTVHAAVAALRPGAIVLLTGPSGSGKSTLLREAVRRVRLLGRRVALAGAQRISTRRRVIDMPDGTLARALAILGQAGLAEAGPLLRRHVDLSEGQRHRLSLAMAISRCRGRQDVLVADEFAATLDRETAMCLAVSLARWARREQLSLLVATSHLDVASWLEPDLTVTTSLDDAPQLSRRPELRSRPGRAPRGR